MYLNLEAELSRRKITREMLAKALNVSISTISVKMTGKSKFTLDEAFSIKEFLNTDESLEHLFKSEDVLKDTG